MSRPETFTRDYSVEVSASAWGQLSQLPLDTYRCIRRELEAVALGLAHQGPPPAAVKTEGEGTPLSFSVGDYLALYEVEPERRRLTLLKVVRQLPQEVETGVEPARRTGEQAS